MPDLASLFDQAAAAIAGADAVLIGAGAGMGVDSGLPDFRGTEGFWKAYPPFARLGLEFATVANPRWFRKDPELAWGFYGHRRNLYRATTPHAGFGLLLQWAGRMKHGAFVFTSNVDGHFQKAGFADNRICEVHGTLEWMQCRGGCGAGLFPADSATIDVDLSTIRARPPLPACPRCGGLARPNVLMFGDWEFDEERTAAQHARMVRWLAGAGTLVVVELGAGRAIPTVRLTCEQITATYGGTLIRLNMREPQVPAGCIGLGCGALQGLQKIDRRLDGIIVRE